MPKSIRLGLSIGEFHDMTPAEVLFWVECMDENAMDLLKMELSTAYWAVQMIATGYHKPSALPKSLIDAFPDIFEDTRSALVQARQFKELAEKINKGRKG